MSLYVYLKICRCPYRLEEMGGAPEAGLSSCESPSVEAIKQTLALLKNRKCFDRCDISLALISFFLSFFQFVIEKALCI